MHEPQDPETLPDDGPKIEVLAVPPGSILHFHNIDFGRDEETDGQVRQQVYADMLKVIGHDKFLVISTYDDRGEMEVWPEGEAAERLREHLAKAPA